MRAEAHATGLAADAAPDGARTPSLIGVVGAGTMGAGIAQLAAGAGISTRLHDPVPEALQRGLERIGQALERLTAKDRISAEEADRVRGLIAPATELADLSDCEFVIEAAPERIEVKLDLFAALARVVGPDCVLATNTSSLSVSEIAAAVPEPGRVVGLHFFNPAPVMRLVEVVAGQASTAVALAAARAVGEAMGKRVVEATDVPGFIVNRCNRPYSLESLRLLEARVATVEQIDRIARLAGGFRMGPFELMDLIGIETNHAVAEAFFRQTYGEPRYQPSPLQARMIAAGRLGRKTGAGWYEYPDGAGARAPDPEPPADSRGEGRPVLVTGHLPVAHALRARLAQAGFEVLSETDEAEPWLTLACGDSPTEDTGPRARLLSGGSLHGSDPVAAGFHLVPPLANVRLIEVTSTRRTDPIALDRLCQLVHALGCRHEHVRDAPGLVLGRIVCQLINEAAFLIGAGNASAADVDAGMELGVNHPRGPVAWSRQIGLEHIVSVLDALQRELGEERYRVAPLLRQGLAISDPGLEPENR
jgi:3-hydroxybutyryl-CoA dehydrogenase